MNIFTACETKPIILGRQGENEVVTIQFPIAKWLREFGAGGTWVLTNMRSLDPDGYPCVVTSDENYVYWTLTDADVQYRGNGYAQLTYVKNGAVAKSEIFDTYVGKSLDASAAPPEPWKPWVDEIVDSIETKLNKPDGDGTAGQVLKSNGDGTTYWGSGGAVESVNGKTGAVVLDAEDVGALPDDTELFSGDYNDLANKPDLSVYATAANLNNEITRATTAEATKVDKVEGKGLSTNDYTNEDKETLASHSESIASQSSQIANLEALGLTLVNGEINITFDAEGETA